MTAENPNLLIGTWAMGGEAPWGYGPCDEQTAEAALNHALEQGINAIDTAPLFGDGAVERLIGKVLAARPDTTRLVTRVGCRMAHNHPLADFASDHLRTQARMSVERLQQPVQTLLLHTPPIGVLRHGQAMHTLQQLKAEGIAATVGASVFEPEEGLIAIDSGADWVCIPYNAANRKAEALFSAARKAGVRVQVREVLHNGFLVDARRADQSITRFDVRREWPDALKTRLDTVAARIHSALPDRSVVHSAVGYALSHPAVDAVAVGCRTAEQVAALAGCIGLTRTERHRLNTALYGDGQG